MRVTAVRAPYVSSRSAPARENDILPRNGYSHHLPHVVAWNLTQRCNLACAHCYISAGSWRAADNELTTAECRRITDEIFATHRLGMGNDSSATNGADGRPGGAEPAPLFILSGGEPLLRDDLEEVASYAVAKGATVVVGTNGTRLTDGRIESLKDAGVTGVAVSVDSLDTDYHDRFRHGAGALEDTLAAVARLRERELDFIVQTSLTSGNRDELPALVEWAASAGAVAFNLYFLVATGRGAGMRGLKPAENDAVLAELVALEREYRGRMMIRSKCQPQIMRHAYENDTESPLLNYGTRCPCGLHYCRITPEGKVTPCPYMPAVAGDLRRERFDEVWFDSKVFRELREARTAGRNGAEAPPGGYGAAAAGGAAAEKRVAESGSTPRLGGKCGRCEYREVCGGCRARAFADSGDYLAADESCAYEPTGDQPVIQPKSPTTYGGTAKSPTLDWSEPARERMRRIPGFVRGVVTERIENFARDRGYDRVTPEVLKEVRETLPVDFSKKKPFFLRDKND